MEVLSKLYKIHLPVKNKMKLDTVVGGILFTIVAARLLQKGIISVLAWLVLATLISFYSLHMPLTISVGVSFFDFFAKL